MFWMKWICREVRGAAPPCPTTSTMFWEREEDTAADRDEPDGADAAVRGINHPSVVVLCAQVYLLLSLPGQASRSSAESESRSLSSDSALE